jgi:hypothetical protein
MILFFIAYMWLANLQVVHPANKTLELELVVKAETDILFNHVHPVLFSLDSPDSITQQATGTLFLADPELYWETLDPVLWTLELPENVGDKLEVKISAVLALCDKQQGICYFQEVALNEVLNLDQALSKQTLVLNLSRPEY